MLQPLRQPGLGLGVAEGTSGPSAASEGIRRSSAEIRRHVHVGERKGTSNNAELLESMKSTENALTPNGAVLQQSDSPKSPIFHEPAHSFVFPLTAAK